MVHRDALWKGIIEDLAVDFLHFFFPEYVDLIDWNRGFEFLDKDLEQITQPSASRRRHADKLFKVWRKDGEEQWFLVHVEVQGYDDADFAFRMFQYYYRILDRYNRSVTAIAIYTGANRSYHFQEYAASFMGMELTYRFRAFQLVDHDPGELRRSGNPFGLVLETARRAMDHRKGEDEQLAEIKTGLIVHLYRQGLEKDKIRKLLYFISYYVTFEQSEIKRKFEREILSITKTRQPMGIREAILEDLKQQFREEGREEGKEEGREEEKRQMIARAHQRQMPIEDISLLVDLPVERVQEIIEELEKEKND